MSKRNSDDLLRHPQRPQGHPDPPVTVVLDNLSTTEGVRLQALTRTTPALAAAVLIGFIFNTTIIEEGCDEPGCDYIAQYIEHLERLAVSMDGKGRDDQIAALQAGGSLPDTYFGGSSSYEDAD